MRNLWVPMAEFATLPDGRHKSTADKSFVLQEMVTKPEKIIDSMDEYFSPVTEFVVLGENAVAVLMRSLHT